MRAQIELETAFAFGRYLINSDWSFFDDTSIGMLYINEKGETKTIESIYQDWILNYEQSNKKQ